jgi:hypothetical protein
MLLLVPDNSGLQQLVSIDVRQCLDATVPWRTRLGRSVRCALCSARNKTVQLYIVRGCMLFLEDTNAETLEYWRRGTRAVLLASYVGWLFKIAQETRTL